MTQIGEKPECAIVEEIANAACHVIVSLYIDTSNDIAWTQVYEVLLQTCCRTDANSDVRHDCQRSQYY